MEVLEGEEKEKWDRKKVIWRKYGQEVRKFCNGHQVTDSFTTSDSKGDKYEEKHASIQQSQTSGNEKKREIMKVANEKYTFYKGKFKS